MRGEVWGLYFWQMGAEKVRDGACAFSGRREGIGAWSDRVRDSGCGVCEVRCRGSGVECGRVSFDVPRLKMVHDLSLQDDWQGGKKLWRLGLILVIVLLLRPRPRKACEVMALNLGSRHQARTFVETQPRILRFVPRWLWFCIWMCLSVCHFQSHIWPAYVLRSFPLKRVNMGSWLYTFLAHTVLTFLFSLFFCWLFCCAFLSLQLFVIVVWNFELYMIPLALLLPLAWNYILIASGKDTRQDVVSVLAVGRLYFTDDGRSVSHMMCGSNSSSLVSRGHHALVLFTT